MGCGFIPVWLTRAACFRLKRHFCRRERVGRGETTDGWGLRQPWAQRRWVLEAVAACMGMEDAAFAIKF